MATQVSSLAQMLRGYDEDGGEGERRELVTRDLLGGAAAAVDLELHAPAGGWDRRLDLPPGNTHLQKHDDPNPLPGPLNDLNLPPPPSAPLPLPTCAASAEYRSVCTLEKVKSALQRESRLLLTRPLFPHPDASSSSPPSPSSSSSSSSATAAAAAASTNSTSSSVKRATARDEGGAALMVVAACPVCLLYVLIAKDEPRCPRCGAHVPVNNEIKEKKPRIDLNFSLHTSHSDLC